MNPASNEVGHHPGYACSASSEEGRATREPPSEISLREAEALYAAVAAIYFADSADYLSALCTVAHAILPRMSDLLERNEHAAYEESERIVQQLRGADPRPPAPATTDEDELFEHAHRAYLAVTKPWHARGNTSWPLEPEYVSVMLKALAPRLAAYHNAVESRSVPPEATPDAPSDTERLDWLLMYELDWYQFANREKIDAAMARRPPASETPTPRVFLDGDTGTR